MIPKGQSAAGAPSLVLQASIANGHSLRGAVRRRRECETTHGGFCVGLNSVPARREARTDEWPTPDRPTNLFFLVGAIVARARRWRVARHEFRADATTHMFGLCFALKAQGIVEFANGDLLDVESFSVAENI